VKPETPWQRKFWDRIIEEHNLRRAGRSPVPPDLVRIDRKRFAADGRIWISVWRYTGRGQRSYDEPREVGRKCYGFGGNSLAVVIHRLRGWRTSNSGRWRLGPRKHPHDVWGSYRP
jgi:hypothetical protein